MTYNGFEEGTRVVYLNDDQEGTVDASIRPPYYGGNDWAQSSYVPVRFDSGRESGILPHALRVVAPAPPPPSGVRVYHGFHEGMRVRHRSSHREGYVDGDARTLSWGPGRQYRWEGSDYVPVRWDDGAMDGYTVATLQSLCPRGRR